MNALFSNSAIFVDLFFVLSGFVIFKGYAQDICDQTVRFKQFAFLRLMRLYPVHFSILMVWLAYVGAKTFVSSRFGIGDPQGTDTPFVLFFENLFLINSFGISGRLNWNYPTWSVSAELFAYLTFFVFLTVCRNSRDRVPPVMTWALCVSVASYLALYLVGLSKEFSDLVYRHSDFGFLRGTAGFFAGVALAQFDPGRFVKRGSFSKDTLTELLLVAAALCLISISKDSFALQLATVMIFVTVIGYFSGRSQGVISLFLNSRIMQGFGRVSYSFYLWHILVYLLVTDVFQFIFGIGTNADGFVAGSALWFAVGASLLITYVLSFISYRLIEEPARRWSKNLVKARSRTRSSSRTLGVT